MTLTVESWKSEFIEILVFKEIYRTGDLRSGTGSDLCQTYFLKSTGSGWTDTFGHLPRKIYYFIEYPS